jgi:hypothetical protein
VGAGQDGQVAGAALDRIAADLAGLAVPIDALQLAPDNARRHDDRGLDAIAASLARFGQRKPIVAKRRYRGSQNVVVAGNGTLLAARRLGWSHVAVAWLPDGMSDDAAREFAVVDNRSAELSEWDAGQLAALAADGVDLAAIWRDDADLSALLSAPVTDADWASAFDRLPAQDRAPIQQMTFTLSDAQAETVRAAIARAKAAGPLDDPGNENSNGRALHRIAEAFLGAHP